MELAEAAHREALRDIKPRPERRASPFPGMADLPAPFFPRDSTYGTLFAKLSRCVRQTILLEARLAAGAYDQIDPAPRAPRAEPQQPASPPQTPRAPEHHPRLRAEKLEDDLAADASRPPAEILASICGELSAAIEAGLPPDRPAEATPQQTRPEFCSPPRLSQAERAMRAALQQGIPPPPKPR